MKPKTKVVPECSCGAHDDPKDCIVITDTFPNGSIQGQVYEKDRLVRETTSVFPQKKFTQKKAKSKGKKYANSH